MHDERTLIESRFMREFHLRIRPAVFGRAVPFAVSAYEVPGEPVPHDAIADVAFTPVEPGGRWGRPWGTTWFRLDAVVPDDWPAEGIEALIDLGFSGAMPGFQCEGLVYEHGVPRRGVHPRNHAVPLPAARPGQAVSLLVEAASNPDFISSFSPNPLGSRDARDGAPLYRIGAPQLVWRDPEVDALNLDLEVLQGVMAGLDRRDPRRHRILRALERALDAVELTDVAGTAAAARAELAPALAVPARASAHRVAAIGHAHIDTAWLWPLRETVRKCTRTFSSAVELMDAYPEYRFACSQAAQYAWIEERHPELFARIQARAAEGRWVPVGGMWVEADMNLPGGESLVRQLVHGQRYFASRFGSPCREIWIPDVFGYPGTLPQIFVAGGCDRFITQKLSWNKTNKIPHHTFWWEGIDGTRVLTHFPPVDTYNAEITPRELQHASAEFADKGWSDWSLMPFGYGDGGGGPTREMLERARRMADLDGVGPVTIASPDEFFAHVEADGARGDIPVWRGELYFEMHRGTFTSQIETKAANRRCERLLREAELWSAASADEDLLGQLDGLWKRVLLQQFHDIIPGSSINWVHAEAEEELGAVAEELEAIVEGALLAGFGGPALIANAATHERDEVVLTDGDPRGDAAPDDGVVQRLADGRRAWRTVVPGLGAAPAVPLALDDGVVPVRVDEASGTATNGVLAIAWDAAGDLVSIVDERHGRELLPAGRAVACTLAPDHPVEFDAWDLERWTARLAGPLPAGTVTVEDAGPLVATVRVDRSFGASTLTTRYRLRAGAAQVDLDLDVDWHEDEAVLCLDVPLDVRSEVAACGVQFGSVDRPMHTNTSWDLAKFEVCAHRWVDVSEPGFGVAVLDDGRYGHALQDGGVRVTLLRAACYPDPTADRGRHACRLAIAPHAGDRTHVVRSAEAFDLPLRLVPGSPARGSVAGAAEVAPPAVVIDHPAVLVSAVKAADDGSGDLIVRLHEAVGGRATVRVQATGTWASVATTDLMEVPGASGAANLDVALDRSSGSTATVALDLRPFQLVTLRLSR